MKNNRKGGFGLLDGAARVMPWMTLVCFADPAGDPAGGGADPAGGVDPAAGADPARRSSAAALAAAVGVDPAANDPPAAFNGTFDLALVPDNLRGENAEETLHKMWPAFKGFRDKQAAQGSVPEKPDAYALPELSDDAKRYFPDLETDQVFGIVRNMSHKHGITAEKFGPLWGDVLEGLSKSGLIQPIIDTEEEARKLGDTTEAARQIALSNSFIDRQKLLIQQQSPNAMPKELIDELDMIGGTANGVKLINWFQNKMGEKGVILDDPSPEGGTWTREKVRTAMRDPRYRADSTDHDPDFRNRVDEANRALSKRAPA